MSALVLAQLGDLATRPTPYIVSPADAVLLRQAVAALAHYSARCGELADDVQRLDNHAAALRGILLKLNTRRSGVELPPLALPSDWGKLAELGLPGPWPAVSPLLQLDLPAGGGV